MPQYLHSIHFTLDQARNVLLEVAPLVEEMVSLKRTLDAHGYDVYRHRYFGGSGPNGERAYPRELERIVELAEQLEEKGVLLKSVEEGLIDFPHIRSNGEEVYLCWKIGETDIQFWHQIPDGFAGRRSIDDL